MRSVRLARRLFAVTMMSAAAALGQSYPNKPIRIVTAEIGAGADFVSRLVAQGMSIDWGQQVIVDNRGGSTVIAAQAVSKAPPDGYTVLLYGSNVWLLPFLQENCPYDPVRDFAPITMAIRSPNVLVVNPSLPVLSVKDLIALGKSHPGTLNYATGPGGTSNHLAAELFKTMAGVNMVRVTYKGTVPALADVSSGQVQLMFANAAPVIPFIKSGRVRALAVTSAQPSALFPDLPTVANFGMTGYESVATLGVLAPSHTEQAIITRLHQEIVKVLNSKEVKDKLFASSVEVVASTPTELAAAMKKDMATTGKLIKDSGIREE